MILTHLCVFAPLRELSCFKYSARGQRCSPLTGGPGRPLMEVRERRRSGKRRAGGESRVEKASRRGDGLKRKERNMRTRISPPRLAAGTPQTWQRHPRRRGLKRLRVIRNVYVEKEQILRRKARGRPPSILLPSLSRCMRCCQTFSRVRLCLSGVPSGFPLLFSPAASGTRRRQFRLSANQPLGLIPVPRSPASSTESS